MQSAQVLAAISRLVVVGPCNTDADTQPTRAAAAAAAARNAKLLV